MLYYLSLCPYLCAVEVEKKGGNSLRRTGIVGPESSGKTTISRALAAWYGCSWVEEYARAYLSDLYRGAEESDLLLIATCQRQKEEAATAAAKRRKDKLLISDTTQLVMHIWGMYQYGRSHSWIRQAFVEEEYNLQLLCSPDFPWVADPLRELPELSARQQVFDMYEEALQQQNRDYVVLRGQHLSRLQQAVSAISKYF